MTSRPDGRTLPDETWEALRAPFTGGDVLLTDLQIDPLSSTATARPALRTAAIRQRLDEVLGADGWSLDFRVSVPGTVTCRLTIAHAYRSGVGTFSRQDHMAVALLQAAAGFGIGRGLDGGHVIGVPLGPDGAPDLEKTERLLVKRGLVRD